MVRHSFTALCHQRTARQLDVDQNSNASQFHHVPHRRYLWLESVAGADPLQWYDFLLQEGLGTDIRCLHIMDHHHTMDAIYLLLVMSCQ